MHNNQSDAAPPPPAGGGLSRRALVGAAALGGAAVGAGGVAAVTLRPRGRPSEPGSASTPAITPAGVAPGSPVAAFGETQAGILRPAVPQSLLNMLVFNRLPGVDARSLWADLGVKIGELTAGPVGGSAGVTDLSVTVGIGLNEARAAYPERVWPDDLPDFARDQVDAQHKGGDLVLQVCASAPDVLLAASTILTTWLDGKAALAWSQFASRGYQDDNAVTRNPMGFWDGIINPRTADEQNLGVWTDDPGAAAPFGGSTYLVVRRLRIDMATWENMSLDAQQDAVGRRKDTGAPLSGGSMMDEVDLAMKHADGVWKTPAASHARRSHPVFTGRPMMLRRSFGYINDALPSGELDQGLLFISFQADLEQFTFTQFRIDESDDLVALSVATASGAFVVLGGYTASRPLGAL